jgi:hypothetical protein
MKVTRLDLDGTGSPMGLVTRILKIEKDLPIPVPVEELARQLDIEEIAPLEMQGFEGGLLTRKPVKRHHPSEQRSPRRPTSVHHRARARSFPDNVSQAGRTRKIPMLTHGYGALVQ